MDSEKVLIYKDFVLTRMDLDILEGPCYLNDNIIGFYFSYLTSFFNSEDILLIPPSVSYWLANSEDKESARACSEALKLPEKKLVVFAVNDNDDLSGGESGNHWSVMVYGRNINAFVHHDSMEGVNNLDAMKLYEAVKGFMGTAVSSSSKSSKSRNKKKKNKGAATESIGAPSAEIGFLEFPTPQQSNGYDCGLYVMAIARTICQWYTSKHKAKEDNWFSAVEEHVTVSLELTMRTEVLMLVEDLKADSER
jgi:sentrin-specific protease 8